MNVNASMVTWDMTAQVEVSRLKKEFYDIERTFWRFFTFFTEFDVCNENPCDNGGICKNIEGGQFMCKCGHGYRGMTCEGTKYDLWISECSAHSELNVVTMILLGSMFLWIKRSFLFFQKKSHHVT